MRTISIGGIIKFSDIGYTQMMLIVRPIKLNVMEL